MGYYITTKMEVIEGKIVSTPIAFPNTAENIVAFSSWCDWDEWVLNNKIVNAENDITLPENSGSPSCYMGEFQSESVEGMDLTLMETI